MSFQLLAHLLKVVSSAREDLKDTTFSTETKLKHNQSDLEELPSLKELQTH